MPSAIKGLKPGRVPRWTPQRNSHPALHVLYVNLPEYRGHRPSIFSSRGPSLAERCSNLLSTSYCVELLDQVGRSTRDGRRSNTVHVLLVVSSLSLSQLIPMRESFWLLHSGVEHPKAVPDH